MLAQLGILLLGLIILYFGAEWLIRGASSLAVSLGIRPLMVGLTVVALGTSMPEFMTNLLAVMIGKDGLALGNVIGSNIANIGLILGLSALLLPIHVGSRTLSREYMIMLAVMVLFYVLALDGTISRSDGAFLLAGLIAFLAYLVETGRRQRAASAEVVASPDLYLPGWKKAVLILFGTIALALGAHLMVDAAVAIAAIYDIPPVVVGLTIVAVGTSLPELAASVVGALRRQTDLSLGNVLGSNLFNVLFVIGLVAVIRPLTVDQTAIMLHFPVMLGFSILISLGFYRNVLGRVSGSLLLAGFLGYMAYLVLPLI
jgi:cation:H+ antiporter